MAQCVSVAPDVHPGLLRFPAAIHGRLGRESGVHTEVVQEPIRVEREEIPRVHFLRSAEWSVEEAHIGQGKRRCSGCRALLGDEHAGGECRCRRSRAQE